ncbi:MAG: ABC transporter permease [Bryobacteraceae bacterium]
MVQVPTSYPQFRRFSEQGDLFSSTMAYAAPVPFEVSRGGGTERIWGHLVSASYFPTLGVHPALGRFFDAGQEHSGQPPIVVVSDRYWRDHLGGDPQIVGQTLRINGQPSTVIGVAPDHFLGASPILFRADLWMPVSAGSGVAPELADNALERRDLNMFFVVGRLNPGVTISRAEAELDAVARQFDRDRVDVDNTRKDRRVLLAEGGKMFPLRKQDVPFFTSFLTAMAGLIMLIACANVANVMLARATGRRREIAVRLAVGASRARLIRQLLTESTVLSLVAGVAGFLASRWLMALFSQVRMPFPMPMEIDFRPDGHVLLLTLALSLCTGLVFGLAPALQATKTDLASALKEGGSLLFGTRRRFNLRNALIVWQVAGSLTLLAILGLMSLGIRTTLGVQAGFNPQNLYLIAVDPARDGYSGERAAGFFDKLLDRVRSLPSVRAAALTDTVPVSLSGASVAVSASAGEDKAVFPARQHVVGEGYFETAGIPIRIGRSFGRQDTGEHSAGVIISEALAERLWDGRDSVGRAIEIGNGELAAPKILPGSIDHRPTVPGSSFQTFEVIGVAADVAEGMVVGRPQPVVYFPLRPFSYSHPSLQGVTLMLRAAPGADVLSAARREISAIDPGITPFDARSMNDQIDQFMAPLRIGAWTYAVIGIFGLALVSVGLAGVTAYAVAQRRREIGVRIALGARNRDVLSLMMREGFGLVAAGIVIGMGGAWAGSRLLSSMNSSVSTVTSTSASDPRVLIGAPLLVALIALIACYLPARRSTRIDPMAALRQE